MICYRDRTWCCPECSKNCMYKHKCGRVITKKDMNKAATLGLPFMQAWSPCGLFTKDGQRKNLNENK